MDKRKQTIQKYLSQIENFLTSALKKESTIETVSSDPIEQTALLKDVQKNDLFIFARDEINNSDIIILMDEEWLGLLSIIMLDVEEKTNNEITRDLLMKFAKDMSEFLEPILKEDGIECKLSDISIFTPAQLKKAINHTEYLQTKLGVKGLADDQVRAELLIGDPETIIEDEENEEKINEDVEASEEKINEDVEASEEKINEDVEASEENSDSKKTDTENHSEDKTEKIAEEDENFKETAAEDMESEGNKEVVISAKHAEFDDFTDPRIPGNNGSNGDSRCMDVLRDVKMALSVELGRIELPLGKVLQLSKGSVIELEKMAGEPVDILVNGLCIAKGEVVVIDEHFGVRIASLITTKQRLASLN